MAFKPSPENILLVEGTDDLHVVANLLKYHLHLERVEPVINIQNRRGVDNLLATFPRDFLRPQLSRLGLVVDADNAPADRWQAIKQRLMNVPHLDIATPLTMNPEGTILTATLLGKPLRIGIWLMPDNQIAGLLEDFLTAMIASDNRLWQQAQQCVDNIPPTERHFSLEHQSKAYLYTWLAWQKEAGKPFGQAIQARYLSPETPLTVQFITWLKNLFEITEE